MTGLNQLEATVGTQRQVLPLETSGAGTLKPVDSSAGMAAVSAASKQRSPSAMKSASVNQSTANAANSAETLSNEELLQLLKQLNQP